MAAEIFAAFMHLPRTRRELYEFVGVPRASCILEKYVRQFRASGLLYIKGHNERGDEIIALQPKPFEHEDAPPPPRKESRRAGEGHQRERLRFDYRGESLTIPELAKLAGVSDSCMWQRLKRKGCSAEAAVAMGAPRTPGPRKSRGARHDSMQAYAAARGLA